MMNMMNILKIRMFFVVFVISFLHVFTLNALAEITSRSVLLMNMSNGRILYQKNPSDLIPPASLTKVLSMFITLDMVKEKKISLEHVTKINASVIRTGGSRMRLRLGEKISIKKLLLGMAVSSGNNASVAVAQVIAKDNDAFTELMNKKAHNLGMRSSTFNNPHGLPSDGQLTTAYDMVKLARSYLATHPDAMKFHNLNSFKHNNIIHKSTNKLLGKIDGLNGLKTGYTDASGYNLIFTAKRGSIQLLGVILGGKSRVVRDEETIKILEAGFAHPNSSAKVSKRLNI